MTVIYESVIEVDITKCMKLAGAVPSSREKRRGPDIRHRRVGSLQSTVYSLQSTVYSLHSQQQKSRAKFTSVM